MYSHPKLQKLDEVVLQHFETWAESSGTPTHTCIRVYTGDDGIIPNRGIIVRIITGSHFAYYNIVII